MRASVGAFGVLLLVGALAAGQSSARQPCRIRVEDLQLTLQEVRIDGALATQTSPGRYSVDGGAAVEVDNEAAVSLADDTLTAPLCTRHTSRIFGTSLSDPFGGAGAWLVFEAVP